MPRPRGLHGRNESTAIAVRVPDPLLARIHEAAGATGGSQLAEWHRNVLRHAVGIPLDIEAGYEEGKMQGWAESQERMLTALKGSIG